MDQLLKTLPPFCQQHWAMLAIGLGVGALAFLVGRTVLRGDSSKKGSLDNLDLQNASDRRADLRRKGNPIDVDLSDPRGRIEPFSGWVWDRSRGGLGINVQMEIPVGTVLIARPRINHNTFSVPIEVRCCRPSREGYIIGCQFVQAPPWNVLMLFG